MKNKIKNYPQAWFICKDQIDFTATHFKTKELAEKYAKKMGFENYEIKMIYLMTR
jgi:hypothetical protein